MADEGTEIFREWIWKIQDEQKISQNKIADKADVSPQSISRWICGKSTPYLRDVVKIVEAFGYHIEIVPNEGGWKSSKGEIMMGNKSEWIGADKKPPKTGRYLVWGLTRFVPDHCDEPNGFWETQIANWFENLGWDRKVKFWQMLPEPPVEESK